MYNATDKKCILFVIVCVSVHMAGMEKAMLHITPLVNHTKLNTHTHTHRAVVPFQNNGCLCLRSSLASCWFVGKF